MSESRYDKSQREKIIVEKRPDTSQEEKIIIGKRPDTSQEENRWYEIIYSNSSKISQGKLLQKVNLKLNRTLRKVPQNRATRVWSSLRTSHKKAEGRRMNYRVQINSKRKFQPDSKQMRWLISQKPQMGWLQTEEERAKVAQLIDKTTYSIVGRTNRLGGKTVTEGKKRVTLMGDLQKLIQREMKTMPLHRLNTCDPVR